MSLNTSRKRVHVRAQEEWTSYEDSDDAYDDSENINNVIQMEDQSSDSDSEQSSASDSEFDQEDILSDESDDDHMHEPSTKKKRVASASASISTPSWTNRSHSHVSCASTITIEPQSTINYNRQLQTVTPLVSSSFSPICSPVVPNVEPTVVFPESRKQPLAGELSLRRCRVVMASLHHVESFYQCCKRKCWTKSEEFRRQQIRWVTDFRRSRLYYNSSDCRWSNYGYTSHMFVRLMILI